jgi:signal transduction histidine kinase
MSSSVARPDGERSAVWHQRLPNIAFAFVVMSLLALATTPILMFRRLAGMRQATAATSGRAAPLVSKLRSVIAEEIIMHERFRFDSDAVTRSRYEQYRALDTQLLDSLVPVAHRVSAAAGRHAEEMRRIATAWHRDNDALVDGTITEQQFTRTFPRTLALSRALSDADSLLADDVERAEAREHDSAVRLVTRQRMTSSALGVLAILAVMVVGWFARREQRLTVALVGAVDAANRLRAQSERRREDLVRMSESKGRLVRGFTHDVKNPIGAADGYLQLVEDEVYGPLAAKQRSSIVRARGSLKAALKLIGDLLEMTTVETTRVDVKHERMDLCEVAREAAEEYRAQAEAKGLTMTVEISDDACITSSDAGRVRQVLGNLISNAVKYTAIGSVTVRVVRPFNRDPASSAPAGDRVAVEVSDTGKGIPKEKLRHVFEEFVRLDPDGAPGAGIGLAMSRRITDALGGNITLRSEVGTGSTFTLWLPVDASPVDAAAAWALTGRGEMAAR